MSRGIVSHPPGAGSAGGHTFDGPIPIRDLAAAEARMGCGKRHSPLRRAAQSIAAGANRSRRQV